MKTETIEEFLARGGKIVKCETMDVKNKKFVRRTKKNYDRNQYDYSNADYPDPLKY